MNKLNFLIKNSHKTKIKNKCLMSVVKKVSFYLYRKILFTVSVKNTGNYLTIYSILCFCLLLSWSGTVLSSSWNAKSSRQLLLTQTDFKLSLENLY